MNKLSIFNPFGRPRAKPAELLAASASAISQRVASVPTTYSSETGQVVAAQPKKQGNYLNIRDVIDRNAHLVGNLTTENSVMVDGVIDGNLVVTGTSRLAIVRESSVIHGDVSAHMVLVAGTIDGSIHARTLRLLPTAVVKGSIQAERMGVDPGAQMLGAVVTVTSESAEKPGDAQQPRAAAASAAAGVIRPLHQAAAGGTVRT